jgi:hypothetical protein
LFLHRHTPNMWYTALRAMSCLLPSLPVDTVMKGSFLLLSILVCHYGISGGLKIRLILTRWQEISEPIYCVTVTGSRRQSS